VCPLPDNERRSARSVLSSWLARRCSPASARRGVSARTAQNTVRRSPRVCAPPALALRNRDCGIGSQSRHADYSAVAGAGRAKFIAGIEPLSRRYRRERRRSRWSPYACHAHTSNVQTISSRSSAVCSPPAGSDPSQAARARPPRTGSRDKLYSALATRALDQFGPRPPEYSVDGAFGQQDRPERQPRPADARRGRPRTHRPLTRPVITTRRRSALDAVPQPNGDRSCRRRFAGMSRVCLPRSTRFHPLDGVTAAPVSSAR